MSHHCQKHGGRERGKGPYHSPALELPITKSPLNTVTSGPAGFSYGMLLLCVFWMYCWLELLYIAFIILWACPIGHGKAGYKVDNLNKYETGGMRGPLLLKQDFSIANPLTSGDREVFDWLRHTGLKRFIANHCVCMSRALLRAISNIDCFSSSNPLPRIIGPNCLAWPWFPLASKSSHSCCNALSMPCVDYIICCFHKCTQVDFVSKDIFMIVEC